MRVLICLLIMSLFIGGYSAAADACAPAACHHEQSQTPDSSAPKADAGKDAFKCTPMDCHHCCMGMTAIMPVADVAHWSTLKIWAPLLAENPGEYFAPSLLRPPRNLA